MARDVDKGAKALAKAVKANLGVKVGLVGPKAAAQHDGGGGMSVGDIGNVHEFGLGNNPERPWLRGYVDENQAQIKAKIKRVAEAVAAGKMTPEAGLDLLGLDLVGGIKQRIQGGGVFQPVTAKTQARKGADKTTTLINSAQFIGSITHQVDGQGAK